MKEHAPELLTEAVARAVSGNLCVSAWLGFANVLFLGFGKVPQGPRGPDGRWPLAPFEIETNMADWRVSCGASVVSRDDEREQTERCASALVGRPVTGWRLGDRHALTLEFDDTCTLEIIPFSDPDVADSDAWCVSSPDRRIVAVSCDGRVVSIDAARPIGEWFSNSSDPR